MSTKHYVIHFHAGIDITRVENIGHSIVDDICAELEDLSLTSFPVIYKLMDMFGIKPEMSDREDGYQEQFHLTRNDVIKITNHLSENIPNRNLANYLFHEGLDFDYGIDPNMGIEEQVNVIHESLLRFHKSMSELIEIMKGLGSTASLTVETHLIEPTLFLSGERGVDWYITDPIPEYRPMISKEDINELAKKAYVDNKEKMEESLQPIIESTINKLRTALNLNVGERIDFSYLYNHKDVQLSKAEQQDQLNLAKTILENNRIERDPILCNMINSLFKDVFIEDQPSVIDTNMLGEIIIQLNHILKNPDVKFLSKKEQSLQDVMKELIPDGSYLTREEKVELAKKSLDMLNTIHKNFPWKYFLLTMVIS